MRPSAPASVTPSAHDRDIAAFGVAGVLRIVAMGGSRVDLGAVARDVARMREPANGTPEVDVRFVDTLAPTRLRILQGGSMGYDDDGVYFLDRWKGTPIARVSQGERWGEAEIVCTRAPNRVPHLSAALDLAAIASGRAPIHGSAWVTREGRGVLVSGWAHSGKTGALLAACEAGAVPVGDDRVFLAADGSMIGTGRPIGVKAWHMAQLRLPTLSMGPFARGLASAAAATSGVFPGKTRLAAKALARLQRSFEEELPPERLGAVPVPAQADVLIILETHPMASILVERTNPGAAARRVAAQTEVELMSALETQPSFKYALDRPGWRDVEQAPGIVSRILEEVAPRIPAYVVRHPYPCSLSQLLGVIERAVAEV